MEIAIGVAVGLVFAVVGFVVGKSGAHGRGVDEGRAAADQVLHEVAGAIARGRLPDGADTGTAAAELRAALQQGWAPRETERQAALREAIGRVSGFLASEVRAPLAGAGEGASEDELRDRIERALGALSDVDFFLEAPPTERDAQDVVPLVKQVGREFAADHDVGLRLQLDGKPVRASVNPQVLMDALYLVLHNAARFGGSSTVDVGVLTEGGRATIRVRDRGEGFSEEAFKRAFDPFYSTTPSGLGLGLPHARSLVEGMGGQVGLRNVPDGGAEVELSFPAA